MCDSSNGRLVSFIIEGDDFISCEYYFLDFIKCPTCRATFNVDVAKKAPTNYDLCKILENVQKGREVNNVTVIHVPDPVSGTIKRTLVKSSDTISPRCRSLANKSTEAKHLRCSDCKRKLDQKHLAKIARYCDACSSSTQMTYACLECCVNSHNGHKLLSVNQLEVNQLKTVSEFREIRKKVLDVADEFDNRVEELRSRNRLFCSTLINEKQNLLTSILSNIDEAISLIESSTLLIPVKLAALRNQQLHNYAKMTKLMSYLEKNMEEASNSNSLKISTASTSQSGSSTCSLRQSRLQLRDDDSLSRESVKTLICILNGDANCRQLAAVLQRMRMDKQTVNEKKQSYVRITQLLTQILYEDITLSLIPLFAEALLNCFYQLNGLSKKRSEDNKNCITRQDIWKNVQFAYTELLKIAAKSYPAYHPERVDIVDDLAYLCHLYADVCDQPTVTICMIESARARAAENNLLTEEDRSRTEARLKLIDHHLLGCRQQQKINSLRTKTRTKRDSSIKRMISCFRAQNVAS
ncbi:hypothetical protein WR25_20416 isoform A [Diploscapter pachys]|uniref:Uncharacterized protein n=1 Tax=Diploscapter pachys TaxID=2018661 RepID=A0A2A2JLW2_9BILA|nr:hypothetical protein WR25_20416 isoform A [Diploscapter pachys]